MISSMIAARLVPPEVDDGEVRLEWGWHENRPYLRLLARRMTLFQERQEIEEALDTARILLALDPNDSQGIRGEAVGMALDLEDPEAALGILEPFGEDDLLVESLYGRALSLLMLGEKEAATEALDRAIADRPLVAQRILRPDLPEPKMSSFGVTVGGEDEAFFYAARWGSLWRADPEIVGWLEERYDRHERAGN